MLEPNIEFEFDPKLGATVAVALPPPNMLFCDVVAAFLNMLLDPVEPNTLVALCCGAGEKLIKSFAGETIAVGFCCAVVVGVKVNKSLLGVVMDGADGTDVAGLAAVDPRRLNTDAFEVVVVVEVVEAALPVEFGLKLNPPAADGDLKLNPPVD